MNLLDRAIAAVSPAAGLRRMAARAGIDQMKALSGKRTYDGARVGQKKGSPFGRDWAQGHHLSDLRRGARYLDRNSAYAGKAMDVLANNAIGEGWMAGFSHVKRKNQRVMLENEYERWCKVADFRGKQSFDGLCWTATRAMLVDGEIIIRFHWLPWKPGDPIPLRLELLPIDLLSSGSITKSNVIDGIEYDDYARPVAYYFSQEGLRRDGSFIGGKQPVRVPADEIIHLYEVLGPLQWRGITRMARAMLRISDLEEYEEARLIQAKIAACFAAFVTDLPTSNGLSTSIAPVQSVPGRAGQQVEQLAPGLIAYLKPGQDVKTAVPQRIETGGYVSDQIRAIAVGCGVMYEQISGDLQKVNYSSFRAGDRDFKRSIKVLRQLTLLPQLFDRVWNQWARAAAIMGMTFAPSVSPVWTPPAFESVDRRADAEADRLELLNGTATEEQLVLERGVTVAQQIASHEASKELFAARKGGDPQFDKPASGGA